MKRSLFLTFILTALFLVPAIYAGNVTIGNNQSGYGTAEDTVTIGGYVNDSTGNIIVPDSFVVMVVDPVGDSTYCDGLNTSDSDIRVMRGYGAASNLYYARFTKAIADIDGLNARVGTYTVFFTVMSKTAVGSFTAGYNNTFIGSIVVNPTLQYVNGVRKVYYYNTTVPAVVDSVQYRMGSTVFYVEKYVSADKQKPDSLITSRK